MMRVMLLHQDFRRRPDVGAAGIILCQTPGNMTMKLTNPRRLVVMVMMVAVAVEAEA
jgi:hypothetical protein